jgi:hypothetical protein
MVVGSCAYCGMPIEGTAGRDWLLYTNFRRYLKIIESPNDDPTLGMLPQQYVCKKCHEYIQRDKNELHRGPEFMDGV